MAADNFAKPILLITGAMAAGKSTLAQQVAERLEPSVHLRGDIFRRMIVNGRVEMSTNPNQEAMRQLLLRYRAAANASKLYSQAGFNVVYQDVIIGPVIKEVVSMYDGFPLHVIVLCPTPESIIERESARTKSGYGVVTVEQLQNVLEMTPRIGFWIDTSDQTIEESATVILENLGRARVVSTG